MKHTDFPPIIDCRDEQKIIEFLKIIDNTLPVPLSARTDLTKFVQKNLARGHILTLLDGENIAALAVYYPRFRSEVDAYFDLLATAPEHGGRGYGSRLMQAAEDSARAEGMVRMHLHTNIENVVAHTMYKKRGYEIVETEPKLHMVKELCPVCGLDKDSFEPAE